MTMPTAACSADCLHRSPAHHLIRGGYRVGRRRDKVLEHMINSNWHKTKVGNKLTIEERVTGRDHIVDDNRALCRQRGVDAAR